MEFQIVIDSTFLEACAGSALSPVGNKRVLSILNDYEGGSWRYDKFQDFVWDNIADTALSARERDALGGKPRSQLRESAKKLRLLDTSADVGRGSELAEAVLYGIMRLHYKALPVVPKIFYKQNSNDYAKGADSVHILMGDGDEFTIWFGEAKFYKSIDDSRLSTIIESVKVSLATDKLKKENSIVVSLSDIHHIGLSTSATDKILKALSARESIDSLKPKIRIPILLLHECGITAGNAELTDSYISDVVQFHKDRAQSYFSKQIADLGALHKYADIGFHLILFPVPSKAQIVESFIASAKEYRQS